ncbi:Serine/threonine-protein kinase-like protein CCR4 [Fagus crenata]
MPPRTPAEIGPSQLYQPATEAAAAPPPPVLEKGLSHLVSLGNGGGPLEEFPLQMLLKATNKFSEDHKIGTGSFGSVYRATLDDGRDVAIKRAEISMSSPYTTNRREDLNDALSGSRKSRSPFNA